MKHLFIGIWHTDDGPTFQAHPTNLDLDVEQATLAVTRHADRMDVPNIILHIEDNMVAHEWERNIDVLQSMFDENMAKLRAGGQAL